MLSTTHTMVDAAADTPRGDAPPLAHDPALYAGVLPRRLCAWALDAVVLGLLAVAFWLVALALGMLTLGLATPLLAPLGAALPLLYGTIAISSSLSATPGQAMMGLVVRSEPGLDHPNLAQAFTSTALYLLSWMAGGLPLLAALFSGRRRTLHDLFSGTLVVRASVLRAMKDRRRPRS